MPDAATVLPFPGNSDHVTIDNMPYRRTNRIRWIGALGLSGAPDTLEQLYTCLADGPDVWLPITREPPDAA
jgi:hypothetical protein